jgi:hypothetical protein
LHFWRSDDEANAGGGTVIWETDGPLVEGIPFDDVVSSIGSRAARRATAARQSFWLRTVHS